MAEQIESKAPITDATIDQVIKANEPIDENSVITQGVQLRKLVKDLRDRLETEITINSDKLGNKVDKEVGKGLSTLDFTQADKESIENFNNWSDDGVTKSDLVNSINSYSPRGEIKDIYDFDGTFLANFDSSGLGVTPLWKGWALMNGNNGTPNAQGRVRLTVGEMYDQGYYYSYYNGQTGGEGRHQLTISEMPTHHHNIDNAFKTTSIEPLDFKGDGDGRGGAHNSNPGIINSTNSVGSDIPHENRQPYISVYTVIKIESITV